MWKMCQLPGPSIPFPFRQALDQNRDDATCLWVDGVSRAKHIQEQFVAGGDTYWQTSGTLEVNLAWLTICMHTAYEDNKI